MADQVDARPITPLQTPPCFCWNCYVEAELIKTMGKSHHYRCPICTVAIWIDEEAFYDPMSSLDDDLESASLHVSPSFSRRSTVVESDEENVETTTPEFPPQLTAPPTPSVPTNTPVGIPDTEIPEPPQHMVTRFTDVANFLLYTPTSRRHGLGFGDNVFPIIQCGATSSLTSGAVAVGNRHMLEIVRNYVESQLGVTLDKPDEASGVSTKSSNDEVSGGISTKSSDDEQSFGRTSFSRAEDNQQTSTNVINQMKRRLHMMNPWLLNENPDEAQVRSEPMKELPESGASSHAGKHLDKPERSSVSCSSDHSITHTTLESVPKEKLQSIELKLSSGRIESGVQSESKLEESATEKEEHTSIWKSHDPDVFMSTSLHMNESREQFIHQASRSETRGYSTPTEHTFFEQDGSSKRPRDESRIHPKAGLHFNYAGPEEISTPPLTSGLFEGHGTSTPLSTPRPVSLSAFKNSRDTTFDASEISMMKSSEEPQNHPTKSSVGDCSGKSITLPKQTVCTFIDTAITDQPHFRIGSTSSQPMTHYPQASKDTVPHKTSDSSSCDREKRVHIYPVAPPNEIPSLSSLGNFPTDGTSIEYASLTNTRDEFNMAMYTMGSELSCELSSMKIPHNDPASSSKECQYDKSQHDSYVRDTIQKFENQERSLWAKTSDETEIRSESEGEHLRVALGATLPISVTHDIPAFQDRAPPENSDSESPVDWGTSTHMYPVVSPDETPTHSYVENMLIYGIAIEKRSQINTSHELNMAMGTPNSELSGDDKSQQSSCRRDVIQKSRKQKPSTTVKTFETEDEDSHLKKDSD